MTASTRAPRLFVRAALAAGATVRLDARQAHYLTTVLRRGPGDAALLFNGADGEWSARIAAGRPVSVAVEARVRAQAAGPDLWLLFAPVKRDAIDLIARASTELGASVLWPVATDRTQASRVNLERLTAIAVEAAEQSERLTVPAIRVPVPLATALAACARPVFAAIEREDAPPPPPGSAPCTLLIGPEGGWSEAERGRLLAMPSVRPARLGGHVLRAETAAIVGLGALALPATAPAR